jgi:hypothetical protein
MRKSTQPKSNRVKYAAMLLGAIAVAAGPVAYPAVATAQQRDSDQVQYIECLAEGSKYPGRTNPDGTVTEDWMLECCLMSNGIWKDGDCVFDAQDQVATRHNISGLPAEPVTPMPPKNRHLPGDVTAVSVTPG